MKSRLFNLIYQFPDEYLGYAYRGILEVYTDNKTPNYKGAVVDLTKAITMIGTNSLLLSQLYYWRGANKELLKDRYGSKEDYLKSIELGEKLLRNYPKNSLWLYQLGRSISRLNMPKSSPESYKVSLKYFKKAISNYKEEDFNNLNNLNLDDNIKKQKIIIYNRIVTSYKENIRHTSKYDYSTPSIRKEFCLIMSKSGEEGYNEAYEHIKSLCFY